MGDRVRRRARASCCRSSSLAAGEHVVDVPPTLSARVRLLGSTKAAKNDGNDALSTAIAGLRHCGLRAVRGDDHTTVLRLLVDRYDDLVALRTQAACRLHVVLRELVAGGAPRRLSADRAAKLLRGVRPDGSVAIERKRLAVELLADVRRLDRDLAAIKTRIARRGRRVGDDAARAARCRSDRRRVDPRLTSVTRPGSRPGTGSRPTTAPRRSKRRADPGNGTGSTRAGTANSTTRCTSSRSPRSRHDTPGRVYYDRKLAEGKTEEGSAPRVEATHQRRGLATTPSRPRQPLTEAGPGGHPGTTLHPAWPARILKTGSSDQSLPNPTTNATPNHTRHVTGRPRAPEHPRNAP